MFILDFLISLLNKFVTFVAFPMKAKESTREVDSSSLTSCLYLYILLTIFSQASMTAYAEETVNN